MKQGTSLALSVCMSLVFSQSGLMAKGAHEQGRGAGHGPAIAQNSHGNGQGTVDRDLGTDRAREVGNGKKKGLYKDQYSIGDGRDKDRSHDSHKHKNKVKKLHQDKDDKDRNKH
ncbi:MAG: hypothetical protein ACRD2L_09700 [Terriglobia bacterium]